MAAILNLTTGVVYLSPTSALPGSQISFPSQAIGDIIFADSTTTFTRLADVATGSVLVSGGVGVAPAWSTTPTVASIILGGNQTINSDGNQVVSWYSGVQPQTLYLYNTRTDANTYERGGIGWISNVFTINTQALGGGQTVRSLQFQSGGNISFAPAGAGNSIIYGSPGIQILSNILTSGAFENLNATTGQKIDMLQTLTELLTIASGATTDDTTIQMPANSVILAVAVRCTVTIPVATSFSVGDSGSATRFSTANVSTTAPSTDPGTKAGAYYNASALSIRLTMNGGTPNTSNGRVRVVIYYYSVTPPTS